MRGTPFLYYGEELGARDVPVPGREIIDPPASARSLVRGSSRGGTATRRARRCRGAAARRRVLDRKAVAPDGTRRRRRATWRSRTPIQVGSLDVPDARSGCAGATPALQVGRYRRLRGTSQVLYAFERATAEPIDHRGGQFRRAKVTALRVRTLRRWTVLFDTHEPAATELLGDDHLTLAPHEAIILLAT